MTSLFGRHYGRNHFPPFSCAGYFHRFFCFAVSFLVAAAAFAANPIQLENAKAGTTSWQLSNLSANQADIQGYASLTSVNRGDTISFFVSTTSPTYTIDVYRIGWYAGAGGRKVLGPISRTGILQPMPTPDSAGLRECNWANPYTLAIPNDWTSGVYVAKLTADTSGYQNYIMFTVRDDNRVPAADLLYQSSVNTWHAYNNWGGQSLYGSNSAGGIPAQKVSFNRPYAVDGSGDFFEWEIYMVRFLEREGYDVSYATNVDLHEKGLALITPHKAFLSVGHDEYWSYQMKSVVQQARDQGKHLGFFGPNVSYWQARYEPSTLPSAAANRTLVSYKEAAQGSDPYWLDGDPSNDKYVTTLFRNFAAPPYDILDAVAQPENGLIGVMYHGSPFDGDIVVSDATSWIYAGTGLSNGYHFVGLLGYETDSMYNNGYAPAGLQKVAESPDDWGFSHMTTYTAPSGAVVFATGSMQWSWGLDDFGVPYRASHVDPAAQQTTRNILNRFASSAPPTVPGAPLMVSAIAGNAQATVSFTAPASDGGSAITGYTVTSNPVKGADSNAGSTALSHIVTGLTNGTAYTFTVKATNAVGTGPASAASNSVTPVASTLPGAPTIGAAIAGNGSASVAFTPGSIGSGTLSYYTANCSGVTNTGSASPIVVSGLTNGVAYTCKVKTTSSVGVGPWSAASNSITPATVPDAPVMGSAIAGNAQATVSFTAPASNGGSAITGYTVTSNPAGGTDSDGGGTALNHLVTGLTAGTSYTFTVTAMNAIGVSAPSSASNAIIPAIPTVPGAPIMGSAIAGNQRASIFFNPPSSNGGSAVTGYTVTCTAAGHATRSGSGSSSPIAVSGMTSGVVYSCSVVATNGVGSGAPSATIAVTPLKGTNIIPILMLLLN